MSVYKAQVFDLKEGLRRKAEGMGRAADAKLKPLVRAQAWAVLYAKQYGRCNSDLVSAKLQSLGLPQLGCAAGSLFPKSIWYHVNGETIPSEKPQNHGHHIRWWRLK